MMLISQAVLFSPVDLLITISDDTLANGGADSPGLAALPVPAALPLLAGGIALRVLTACMACLFRLRCVCRINDNSPLPGIINYKSLVTSC